MEVAILSLPRSGSSLIAGILHKSGVPMGNRFNPADQHNPTGYWEDRKLVHTIKQKEGLKRYIQDREGDIWGLKHPDLCGRLADNEEYFDGLHVIHLHRPFEDVVQSLNKMFEHPLREAKAKKRAKYDDLERLEAPVLDVEFYDFVDNPREEYDRICDFLGIVPNYKALQMVDTDNVNHRANI